MKTFYYVDNNRLVLHKCGLHKDGNYIVLIKEDGTLTNYAQSYNENNLFNNIEDAEARLEYLDDLYNKTFKYKPFLKEEKLVTYLEELKYIESEITARLKGCENFLGIDFCDVSAGGIQVRGHHKQITGYTYGEQITIKYDFSNYLECIDRFAEMWKVYDVPDKVRSEQRFIADGEKWGWD